MCGGLGRMAILEGPKVRGLWMALSVWSIKSIWVAKSLGQRAGKLSRGVIPKKIKFSYQISSILEFMGISRLGFLTFVNQ